MAHSVFWRTLIPGLLFISLSALAAEPPKQTVKNLSEAYQGEKAAAERYSAFAEKADAEGLPQAAKLFRAAAKSESIHRDNHAKALSQLGEKIPVKKEETIEISSTQENLKNAIEDEKKDGLNKYPKFISEAKKASMPNAVQSFEFAHEAELGHVRLFTTAESGPGGMKAMDYYVNRKTGVIVEAPLGKTDAVSDPSQFIRIG